MKASISALVVVAGAVALAVEATAQSAQAQIYATVLNEQGGPMHGLQAPDLVLRDEGIRQGVIDAVPAPQPLAVAIVVSGFDTVELLNVRSALESAAKALRAQNADTQVGIVVGTSAPVMITDGQTGWYGALDTPAGANFVDAVVAGCDALSAAPPDRRVVLGIVNTHELTAIVQPERLTTAVMAGHVSLWTVETGTGGVQWSPAVDAALTEAVDRGGALRQKVKASADVPGGVASVVSFLLSQYLVTYAWPDPMLTTFNLVTRHDSGRVLVPMWTR